MKRSFTVTSVRICLFTLLTLIMILSGCAGAIQQGYYKGSLGMSTEGMTPVKDDTKKFDFMLPSGWAEVPQVPLPLTFRSEAPDGGVTEYVLEKYR